MGNTSWDHNICTSYPEGIEKEDKEINWQILANVHGGNSKR